MASGRANGFGPDEWLRAERVASGRAGQPSLQLTVRTGEPTCGSTGTPTGTPTGGSIVPPADAKFGPSIRWFNRPYNQSKVWSSNRWFNRPYNQSKVRSFNRWFNRPSNRRKVRSFNRSFNRRSRQSCQCTSTEVADNATRFRKNSIGNPQKFM